MDEFNPNMGWQCPVCGRGLAPWVETCECYVNTKIKVVPPPGEDGAAVVGLHQGVWRPPPTGDEAPLPSGVGT